MTERLSEMREPIKAFFEEKTHERTRSERAEALKQIVDDDKFWKMVAFLADIFSQFNVINKKMQTKSVNIFMVGV